MKAGRGSNGAPTDLLVCFPSRAHLALMPPKPTCSPSRPASEPAKRRHSTSRVRPPASSPLFKAHTPKRRTVPANLPVDDEPKSPKVTCAGQIKARPAKPKGPGPGKKKPSTWLEALGLKKEAVPFLNALQGFRFNVVGCFGALPGAIEYTSDEDNDNGGDGDKQPEKEAESNDAALAKWFMVSEQGKIKEEKVGEAMREQKEEEVVVPPKNALMLMRCRSAPASGWLERVEAEEKEEEEEVRSARKMREEEKEKERLVLMSYAPDFFKVSVDIAKETWVGGGMDDSLRCRSWKR